jgi:HNH endonuclease
METRRLMMAKPGRVAVDPWVRIMTKVEKRGRCWVWTGKWVSSGGYGIVGIGHRGRTRVYVHRYAYERHHGPIPLGMLVLHTCDSRRCVNPRHLRLGTQQQNLADMVAKGRSCRGERHWNWKGGRSRNYRTGKNRVTGHRLR